MEFAMIEAVCFNCGAEKSAAIKLCTSCRAMPLSDDDRLVSVCLSADCLRQENLEIASKYIKKKNRLPGFRDKVMKKAEKIVEEMPDHFQLSQSFDFTESFIEERFVLDD